MIFEKDPKTRYVDMAIYIDHHIYSGDYDPELVYQYLYFLIYMLAKKKKYFSSEEEYDDFSIWLATKMYVRITDPRQFDENERLDKIVSVLNYIKGILFAKKLQYNSELGFQIVLGKFNSKYIDDFDDDALLDYYRPTISSSNNETIKKVLFYTFESIPEMFRKELSHSPYKKNKVMMNNLYISCLLTFIKTTTPANADLLKVERLSVAHPNVDVSRFEKDGEPEVVLWGIPEYLSDYVKLIYNKVRRDVINDVKDSMSKYTIDRTDLEKVISANYNAKLMGDDK